MSPFSFFIIAFNPFVWILCNFYDNLFICNSLTLTKLKYLWQMTEEMCRSGKYNFILYIFVYIFLSLFKLPISTSTNRILWCLRTFPAVGICQSLYIWISEFLYFESESDLDSDSVLLACGLWSIYHGSELRTDIGLKRNQSWHGTRFLFSVHYSLLPISAKTYVNLSATLSILESVKCCEVCFIWTMPPVKKMTST